MCKCYVCGGNNCWKVYPYEYCGECLASIPGFSYKTTNIGDIREYRTIKIKNALEEYYKSKYYGTAVYDEVYRLEKILKNIYFNFEDV